MMGRIEDKRDMVLEFIKDLKTVTPSSYGLYEVSIEKRLSCERAFEKVVEAVSDLAILFIKEKRLPLPSDDEKAFDILERAGFITRELAVKLRRAKGMRNFLAHQYDRIDDELVFEAIHDEVARDVGEFLRAIGL